MSELKEFYSADMSDEQYYANMNKAYQWYESGETPRYSKGICDTITAGYGKLDKYGYWEYPLNTIVVGGEVFIGEEIY
ncbi:hypothetical protein VP501E541_P0280 [Vibrio phage 501E54-1]|nr:hypothetical protein VP501E541_P0280 [Vibrio phage 501E54-1]